VINVQNDHFKYLLRFYSCTLSPDFSVICLILSSHLRLDLPNDLFLSGFPTDMFCNDRSNKLNTILHQQIPCYLQLFIFKQTVLPASVSELVSAVKPSLYPSSLNNDRVCGFCVCWIQLKLLPLYQSAEGPNFTCCAKLGAWKMMLLVQLKGDKTIVTVSLDTPLIYHDAHSICKYILFICVPSHPFDVRSVEWVCFFSLYDSFVQTGSRAHLASYPMGTGE
jgi:hypothetical protein